MFRISALVRNKQGIHDVLLKNNDEERTLIVPPKASGFGSSATGGELLFLALATCYCNDIYREADRRNIVVKSVQVEVSGEFDGIPGNAGTNIRYNVMVEAEASEAEIEALMRHTDTVAEIQNTLRRGANVILAETKAHSTA